MTFDALRRLFAPAKQNEPSFRPAVEPLEDRVTPVASFRQETGADLAQQLFGVTGRGVAIVIMDRGIDYTHPDFLKPDGRTRIKWMLDLTGQNGTDASNPPGVEYSETQINAALRGGPPLAERDAVGHGTVTAGLAAGNGSAAAHGKYKGMAPEADLIIVKLTSEGAPAHDGQPAEAPFNGNILQALDWVDAKLTSLNEPSVGIINSGTQSASADGTSVVSRKIDRVFGSDRPGRVYVSPSGDEGNLPTHAGGTYTADADTAVRFTNAGTGAVYLPLWYSGTRPAAVSLTLDDGTTVGPIGPGQFYDQEGIFLAQYAPGQEPYPYTSTSGDTFVGIVIAGHPGGGVVRIRGLAPGSGRFDVYGSNEVFGTTGFTDHLVPGRLTDYSTTLSAIVVGAHTLLSAYTDIDGIRRTIDGDRAGDLWAGSSAGPTRDGRVYGVDVTAPGENAFAAYARNSYWATFRSNLIEGGGGWYGRGGATSGSGPIAAGAVALLLQVNPHLTARQVRHILRETARADRFTGRTPNVTWGHGKLNVFLAVLDALARRGGRWGRSPADAAPHLLASGPGRTDFTGRSQADDRKPTSPVPADLPPAAPKSQTAAPVRPSSPAARRTRIAAVDAAFSQEYLRNRP